MMERHIMPEASAESTNLSLEFTKDWFSSYIPVWDRIISQEKPSKILEIGSFEGRSACYLIEKCATLAEGEILITCVDTWEGSIEHRPGAAAAAVMSDVERRFDHNTRLALAKAMKPVALRKVKQNSRDALAGLIASGAAESFDLIYIDGSHEAPDVLADAAMAFPLLRVGGTMIFDDYLWSMQRPGAQDVLLMPKPAIDAFMNIYQRKMLIYPGFPLRQLYARKVLA
jgi:predicted O-methyltransferase YrrM